MKVYVNPPGHLSRAMFRVAEALKRFVPKNIEIVKNDFEADFLVHHVIGCDAITYKQDKPCAVIQYCKKTAGEGNWFSLWSRARVTWSYYDLQSEMPSTAQFYCAPLGIDKAFVEQPNHTHRSIGAITSGYVTGPGAEAIEEVAKAADALGMQTVHIGPKPVGLKGLLPRTWVNVHGIVDSELADIYAHARWVSGLRFVEGFELPVIEGLACGARPIVFDRPEMRRWYDGHAVFVPECDGLELTNILLRIMANPPQRVSEEERKEVLQKFDWRPIVEGFWERVNA